MKFVVLGSSGMVGQVVSLYLSDSGHEVTGYDECDSESVKTITGSLYDTVLIKDTIKTGAFDAVINCTAIINQDAEKDKSGAVFVNSYLPHLLEDITAGTNTIIVHRSTDCIFSGKRGQYGLDDTPDADSFYARTKAIGEVINEKDITIRTSLIGPASDENGSGLLNWFLRQRGDVKGFGGAIWTGITTIEFAHEIEVLLEERAHGLFHCVPDHAISKYELLLLFEKYFQADRNVVRVDNARVDKSLVQQLNDSNIIIPDYESMIAEMASWIKQHKSVFPNYNYYFRGEKL